MQFPSTLLRLLIVPAFLLTACLNPCKNVECQNGGECNNGACECPDAYEGNDCSELARDRFIGTWNMSQSCNSGYEEYEVVMREGGALHEVLLRNVYGLNREILATVAGSNLTVHEQTFDFVTVSGTGSHNGQSITLNLQFRVNDTVENCTVWGSRGF